MGLLWACIIILLPTLALASPAEEPTESHVPILDTAQNLLGFNINRVANRLDLFFADQRADDELARSRIRIRQSYEVRERAKMADKFQLRFNLRLPSLEEKLRFEFKPKDKEAAAADPQKPLPKKDPNKLDTDWQFRSDVGVNASIPPKIFSHGRLRKNWQTWKVVQRFVNELAWYSDQDWENTDIFDSDLPLNENLLLRFRHTAYWKITRKDFQTNHGPMLLHRISDDEAMSYGVNFTTEIIHGTWFLANYRVSTTYRRNLYQHWLYADLTPGLDFPKMWSFRRTPFIFFQLEALFGN